MPDPLSIIALGAAVGGAAGKLAEKTWDSGQRWLQERFGSHSQAVQEKARQNASRFIQHLAHRIEILEKDAALQEKKLQEVYTEPQVSALLQKSLLNAAQTDDAIKHILLAELVAARLTNQTETTFSLASQLASDAIAHSTKRQLQLMALCCFIHEVRLKWQLSVPEYRLWIQHYFNPFEDFEFNDKDAWHLVAIACASYDPACERSLSMLFQMKGVGHVYEEKDFSDLVEFECLEMQWNMGLAGVFLTSVGSIVGGLAFDHLMGRLKEAVLSS